MFSQERSLNKVETTTHQSPLKRDDVCHSKSYSQAFKAKVTHKRSKQKKFDGKILSNSASQNICNLCKQKGWRPKIILSILFGTVWRILEMFEHCTPKTLKQEFKIKSTRWQKKLEQSGHH